MIILLYNLFILLATVVFFPLWLLVYLKESKFRMRLAGFSLKDLSAVQYKDTILVQGDSIGEAQVSARFIQEFKRAFPRYGVVFTTSTRSGLITAQKTRAGLFDVTGFLPLDHPYPVKKFFDRVNPEILIFAESKLRPNILREAKKRGVRVVMLNGWIKDKIYKKVKKYRFFYEPLFAMVDLYCVQNDQEKQKFMELRVAEELIHVTGNIKFDRETKEISGIEIKKTREILGITTKTPVLTAASTHKGEEAEIIRAFLKCRQQLPAVFLLLAPRHPQRAGEIGEMLKKYGLTFFRRGEIKKGLLSSEKRKFDVLVFDTFGELDLAYELSTVAFVGGSLVPIGGHNMLEAAARRKVVLHGPFTHNFREIAALLDEEGVGRVIGNAGDLAGEFLHLYNHKEKRRELEEKAEKIVDAHRGAAGRTVEILKETIAKKTTPKKALKRKTSGKRGELF